MKKDKIKYRTYARYDDQSVEHRTETASKAVADFAWEELKNKKWIPDEEGKTPSVLIYTCNNKQIDCVRLD